MRTADGGAAGLTAPAPLRRWQISLQWNGKWVEDVPAGGASGQASHVGTVWTSKWVGCDDELHRFTLTPADDQGGHSRR